MICEIDPIYKVGEPLEPEMFAGLAEYAHNLQDHPTRDYVNAAHITTNSLGISYSPRVPNEHKEVLGTITKEVLQRSGNKRSAQFSVFSIRNGGLFPLWHTDNIDGAFSLSPDGSTEGISGDVELPDGLPISITLGKELERLQKAGEDLSDGRELLIFPPCSVIGINYYSPHRSPLHCDFRLLVLGHTFQALGL